jgi:hypothetical protein
MKRIRGYMTPAAFAFLALSVLLSASVFATEVTITGTVTEYLRLQAEDEEFYDILFTGVGADFIKLVGARVQVTGTLENSFGGSARMIRVTSYQILEEHTKGKTK